MSATATDGGQLRPATAAELGGGGGAEKANGTNAMAAEGGGSGGEVAVHKRKCCAVM